MQSRLCLLAFDGRVCGCRTKRWNDNRKNVCQIHQWKERREEWIVNVFIINKRFKEMVFGSYGRSSTSVWAQCNWFYMVTANGNVYSWCSNSWKLALERAVTLSNVTYHAWHNGVPSWYFRCRCEKCECGSKFPGMAHCTSSCCSRYKCLNNLNGTLESILFPGPTKGYICMSSVHNQDHRWKMELMALLSRKKR